MKKKKHEKRICKIACRHAHLTDLLRGVFNFYSLLNSQFIDELKAAYNIYTYTYIYIYLFKHSNEC